MAFPHELHSGHASQSPVYRVLFITNADLLSTHADGQGVDISVTVCFCVFIRLRISPPKIKLAASNFARRFIGVYKVGNHTFL